MGIGRATIVGERPEVELSGETLVSKPQVSPELSMLPPSEMVETLRQVPSMIVLSICIVPPVILKALVLSPFLREQGRPFVSMEKQENLVVLKELIEAGKVTPVIDRTYPLSETPPRLSVMSERDTLEERSSSRCEARTSAQIT